MGAKAREMVREVERRWSVGSVGSVKGGGESGDGGEDSVSPPG